MGELFHNYYGISFCMYPMDNKKHKMPHIHAYSGDGELVISLIDCTIIEGQMKKSKQKLALQWTEENIEKLKYAWNLAIQGIKPPKIKDIGDEDLC